MAKAKKPAKKKAAHERVEIKLPVPHDCQLPPEIVAVPVPFVPEKLEPLPAAHGPVRCIATFFRGWNSDYIVIAAKDGHALPEVSENGAEVDVQFFPPSQGAT